MRSLGCSPCTGAIKSDADTVEDITELVVTKHSERRHIIDHDQDGSWS
jgi:sulfate adenylyltransferase subunit 2